MHTAKILKILREKKKLSQTDVAKALGIDRTTYVKYETGASKPVRKLQELANFFNVTTDFLLGNEAARDINSPSTLQLTRQELEHIKKYRQLDADDKNKTDGFMMALLMDDKYKKNRKSLLRIIK